MVRQIKKTFSLLLSIIILAGAITAVSQALNVNTKVAHAATVQTRTVVSSRTGKVVGTLYLTYSTQISGGRPQFVYGSCSASFSATNGYSGYPSIISFSGDLVQVEVDYSFPGGIDTGYATYSFTP